ncbi:hypothetical protein FRB93_009891 [Tulasnella sp. JGI-2019a]|nr:hypothetical protein FRB93_009891 [Tulasnella sp. JGI-2019a]
MLRKYMKISNLLSETSRSPVGHITYSFWYYFSYQVSLEIDRLIALLGNGDSGSSKKLPCIDGTRVSLLNWITRWIEEPSNDGKRSLCLIGAAGRGKSSVGASVAEQERRLGRLGAEFYFIVDQQDRNEGVIPVLARQLASWGGGKLGNEIASAIHADRDIAQRRLEVQFRELVQEPLETLADDPNCTPLVILLDGLDECENDYARRLLDLIGKSFPKLSTVAKFIITSRPEPHLLHRYYSHALDVQLEVRNLDLEEVVEVEGDIEEFYRQELPKRVLVINSSNWLGDKRRKALVQLSQGLWIFAITVARMLTEPQCHDPEELLDALLSKGSDTLRVSERDANLDSVYSRVLNRACPPNSPILNLFRDVLGVLCVLVKPVNMHTLTSIFYSNPLSGKGPSGDIRSKVFGYLQAVLIVPGVGESVPSHDANPIRFVHKSFEDYLTDESRCDTRFLVNITEHRRMAIRCLHRMDDLQKPNICDIDSTTLTYTKVGVIIPQWEVTAEAKDLVKRHISSAVRYAYENWATHVSRSPPESGHVNTSMDIFVRIRLLYWLEVLSLLGMAHRAAELVELVEVWLKKARPQHPLELPTPTLPHRITTCMTEVLVNMHAALLPQTNIIHPFGPLPLWVLDHVKRFFTNARPIQQPDVSFQASALPTESDISTLGLLQDLKNFVVEFEVPIKTSAPHIYRSALPFTPSYTSLSQVYGHLAEGGPVPWRGRLEHWSQQWSAQKCLAWSPDGQRIVSGSRNGILHLWDPSTGAGVGGYVGAHVRDHRVFNSIGINCVAWSPDGRMIVSGSYYHIQLWDSTTGARIGEAWKGHTKNVCSLTWSPDSKRVASGSTDATLCIWDLATGETIGEAWKGHTKRVSCVAWSLDGKKIASGSKDQIRLWESSTGALVGRPWTTTWTYDLAWSPDGKRIVSAADDTTLHLWDVHNGKLIGELS